MNTFLLQTIQRDSSISFPMFGNLTLNPPSYFLLFGREIYFYGVIIAVAFLIGILLAVRNAKEVGLTGDDVYDVVIWMIPISILGARLYFVLFKLDYYLAHPSEILAIWEGGLAIYGGVLAGILAIWLVCRHKKISAPAMLDVIVVSCILGQAIGRWGNFMNREAFGAETDIFCRMGLTDIEGNTIYVHPTFLYESLWNLVGFAFLFWFLRSGKRKYDGQCVLIYFVWYGLGRVWIEGLRTDSLYIGSTGIRVSQLLSAVLVLFGIYMLYHFRKRHSLYKDRKNVSLAEGEATGAEAVPDAEPVSADKEESADNTASGVPEEAAKENMTSASDEQASDD